MALCIVLYGRARSALVFINKSSKCSFSYKQKKINASFTVLIAYKHRCSLFAVFLTCMMTLTNKSNCECNFIFVQRSPTRITFSYGVARAARRSAGERARERERDGEQQHEQQRH